MQSISINKKNDILKIIENRFTYKEIEKSPILMEFLIIGFDQKLKELYEEFQRGETSLGYLADQLGISSWEAVELLEKRGLHTTNV